MQQRHVAYDFLRSGRVIYVRNVLTWKTGALLQLSGQML